MAMFRLSRQFRPRLGGLHNVDRPWVRPDHSSERVNAILRLMPEPTSYLEIGLDDGWTFLKVAAASLVGVDPEPRFDQRKLTKNQVVYAEPSDSYFGRHRGSDLFDVVFVDGLHTAEQTLRDIQNAFRLLKPKGVVVIDDVIPSDSISAIPDQAESLRLRRIERLPGSAWHGDVFRVLGSIAECRAWLNWVTIDDRATDDRRNPQTLVWRTEHPRFKPDFLSPESLLPASFDTVFQQGVPDVFRTCSEGDALSLLAQRLQAPPHDDLGTTP